MRNWASSSSVYEIILGLYKYLGIRSSELIARLAGVRNESWGIVAFENGIVNEVRYK